MRDVDGAFIAGARLSDLYELVGRLPQDSITYFYIVFEGNGAAARIASFHPRLPSAEEKARKLRDLNPGFAIRVQTTAM